MGLQPGASYSIRVESSEIERAMPGEKFITMEANKDFEDLRLAAILKNSAVSVSGSAFFEGEESLKVYK